MCGKDGIILINDDPKENKFLLWSMHSMSAFVIKNVKTKKKLDGREGENNPLLTERSAKLDTTLHWNLIHLDGYYALRSVSSGLFLDGRSKKAPNEPLMTDKHPEGMKRLQWILYE